MMMMTTLMMMMMMMISCDRVLLNDRFQGVVRPFGTFDYDNTRYGHKWDDDDDDDDDDRLTGPLYSDSEHHI